MNPQLESVIVEMEKAVRGKRAVIEHMLCALLAGGHILLDDMPGVGKTTLALAFARALGEYGATSMIAGYTPGKTATIATTVYQLWRTNDEAGAMRWVLVDIVISAVVLLAVNLLEKKQKAGGRA